MLGKANVPVGIQNEVVELVKFEDAEMLSRFERFVARKRSADVDNADGILEEFSGREKRRKWLDRATAFPFLLAVALSVGLLTVAYEPWHWIVWALTALLSLGAIYAVDRREGEYLDPRALAALRARNRRQQ